MNVSNLSLSFGIHEIFNDVNFNFNDDDRVGIIGVNGAGKTTLLKIVKGEIKPDTGIVSINKRKTLGWLPQIIDDNDDIKEMNVLDYLLSGRPIKEINNELESLYNLVAGEVDEDKQKRILNKIGHLQELFNYWEGYKAENILQEIILGMNITYEMLDLKMKNLSGGQKSKVAFARLLYSRPDILLLDEPTNHLDKDSKEYVTEYLKDYEGMILVISHDIDFLNSVINKVLYIDKILKKVFIYNGDYKQFLRLREEEKKVTERIIVKQSREEAKLKAFIAKNISCNSEKRRRQAQSRVTMLDRLLKQKVTLPPKQKMVKLNLQPERECSNVPLKLEGVSFRYPTSNFIIKKLSFTLTKNEKFLIVGVNGVGKSTLLKLINNILIPESGNIMYGPKTDIAYYAQEHEGLNNNLSLIDNIKDNKYTERELRSILGRFLFFGDDVFKKVNILSPGERSRIALAKIAMSGANLLLLDEPTNHLDPETQKNIALTFKDYKGTMLVVSHNPEFVDSIGVERMLILPEGRIEYYDRKKVEYYQEQNTKLNNKISS